MWRHGDQAASGTGELELSDAPGRFESVDIKIGIENVNRELGIESDQSRDDVTAALKSALGDKEGVLTLTDSKGRQLIVPGAKIAYVELGEEHARQVGFGTI